MATQTLLDYLRTRSFVDCDTLDISIGKDLGPFVDCTSNQAISYFEIQKPENAHIITESAQLASTLIKKSPYAGALTAPELTAEIIGTKLSLRYLAYTTSRVHIQANPKYAYSTTDTIANAHRYIALVQHLAPGTSQDRICIKIPTTYAGLKACEVLEKEGIRTLATTLFTMVQAAASGAVGCSYIAPYVNALKVHFTPGFEDHTKAKGLKLCVVSQKFFEQQGYSTQVLPASLTSVSEILQLAGAHHITVPPTLLKALAAEPYNAGSFINTSLYDVLTDVSVPDVKDYANVLDDEEKFTKLVEADDDGKLKQAIDIFSQMQQGLLELSEAALKDVAP
ncbi:uncharacterized protein LAJ45_02607 [Morchella importuna]|uniref:Transaldolase n=1 Tax=Morchella conica CCBAS932 TaxID=1392247 RepID=A0A3N4KAM7_9PEZI|nr:uncharacterized protein LAJ45_02607 [Morchella importuna]KAH8153020.1 hypothetical protein LAJ45_02607 [Morchella importuna]RPB07567.1 transaldolase [Morchella conica CCBAS932]